MLTRKKKLLSFLLKKNIQTYVEKYKYIHIGLLQVAFKLLTSQELNVYLLSYLLLSCLRDARCLNWTQSLMGIMETSLCHGSVYFNVYPDLCLSLTDPNLLEAASLNIKTHEYNFFLGSETIAIVYRIHYKAHFSS